MRSALRTIVASTWRSRIAAATSIDARPPGTRNAPSIDHEEPVGNEIALVDVRETLDEIPVVEPAHTNPVSAHHTGPCERERTRAESDERGRRLGHGANEGERRVAGRRPRMQQPANDHHIVERLGLIECGPRCDLDSTTGPNRNEIFADDGPRAPHRPAHVAFVAREPQQVDEARERGQREVGQQDDPEAQPLRSRGFAIDRVMNHGDRLFQCHPDNRYGGKRAARCSLARNGNTGIEPVVHHGAGFFAQPVPELQILGARPRVAVRD